MQNTIKLVPLASVMILMLTAFVIPLFKNKKRVYQLAIAMMTFVMGINLVNDMYIASYSG